MSENEFHAEQISELSSLLERKRIAGAPSSVYTSSEGRVLLYLLDHYHQKVYEKDIQNHFGIRGSSASELLQKMEKKGLIIRITDPSDRRKKAVVLSNRAAAYRDNIINNKQSLEKTLTQDISDHDLQLFEKTIQKMIENLKEKSI